MIVKLIAYWLLTYLIGAIPFGWLITWNVKHVDIRYHASGRMGMSNVMRTAGTGWGILSGILDVAKGYVAVLICSLFFENVQPWMTSIGGILSVVGHIFSIFLIEKRRDGKFHFRGGAGGMTSVGAGIALSPMYLLFSVIPCLLLYVGLGYASVATAAFNIFAAIGFSVMAAMGKMSWWYVVFCLVSGFLICWSLRPNFKRLARHEERKTSLRIRWRKEDREK